MCGDAIIRSSHHANPVLMGKNLGILRNESVHLLVTSGGAPYYGMHWHHPVVNLIMHLMVTAAETFPSVIVNASFTVVLRQCHCDKIV